MDATEPLNLPSTQTSQEESCVFCRILADPASPLWYRDDRVAVFVPRSPAALLHLLIVPIAHVEEAVINYRQASSASLFTRLLCRRTPRFPPPGSSPAHPSIPATQSLLDHMLRVGYEQLSAHAPYALSGALKLGDRSPPPRYAYPRGSGLADAAAAAAAAAPGEVAISIGGDGSGSHGPETSTPLSTGAGATATSPERALDAPPPPPPDAASSFRFAFHPPPWNSVDHLHMHALLLPHTFGEAVRFCVGTEPGLVPYVQAVAAAAAAGAPPSSVSGAQFGYSAPTGRPWAKSALRLREELAGRV